MPYIEHSRRRKIDASSLGSHCANPGDLNFLITTAIIGYLRGVAGYQGVNDVMGALEGAKMEMYRRYAVPYEDRKILENGDVYVKQPTLFQKSEATTIQTDAMTFEFVVRHGIIVERFGSVEKLCLKLAELYKDCTVIKMVSIQKTELTDTVLYWPTQDTVAKALLDAGFSKQSIAPLIGAN